MGSAFTKTLFPEADLWKGAPDAGAARGRAVPGGPTGAGGSRPEERPPLSLSTKRQLRGGCSRCGGGCQLLSSSASLRSRKPDCRASPVSASNARPLFAACGEHRAARPVCGGDSRDRTGQRRTMAETTAAPVRAMMRGRLCHRGFGGSAEAGDDRGPCRPRGSAAVARPEGPPRTAASGDPGLRFRARTRGAASRSPAGRGRGLEGFLKSASHRVQP